MSFIAQVTISIVIYFIIRFFYQKEKSLYFAGFIAAFSYVLIYLATYEIISIMPTIHFMVTGLSLLFIFIAYNEIIILERKVRKVKKGELINIEPFSVERNYKIVFKLLGIGLIFLSLALVSGFTLQTNIHCLDYILNNIYWRSICKFPN